MRAPFALAVLLLPDAAVACPEVTTDQAPSTQVPCMDHVDFTRVRSALEVGYTLGAGGNVQTAVGETATAHAGLDLGYALQFGGDPVQPSYEIELTAGASVHRVGGDVSATGVVTRAAARLGPAQMNPSVVDEGRGNIAWFPLTAELAHTGEVNARPRIAARPELARSLYARERVELATRLVRVEGAGDKAKTDAPGNTKPVEPTAWALDAITLHGGFDAALQDEERFETTIGGSMLAVREHTSGVAVDIFGIEHKRYDLSAYGTTNLDTIWMLRLDFVSPQTGTNYYMGWGEVIDMPGRDEFAQRIDPEEGTISIGGVGWFSKKSWGGWGAQYKREPFVTMTGEVGLEDRVSGEVYVPRLLGLIARAFAARTTRLVAGDLRHDNTAGIQLDATYARRGFNTKLGVELGRTFYTALDNAMPESTGFVAGLGLTIQHAGSRTWTR